MRHAFRGLALAGMLASAPLWAHAQSAVQARVARAEHKESAAVARQRVEVKRLKKDVAVQESGSKAAAQRLQRQDAEIAELQRKLRAAQQAGPVAGKGH